MCIRDSSNRLPSWDTTLLEKWLGILNLKDWHPSKPCYICSLHFTPDCFIEGLLRDDAVPSLGSGGDQHFQESNEITGQLDYPLKHEVSYYRLKNQTNNLFN